MSTDLKTSTEHTECSAQGTLATSGLRPWPLPVDGERIRIRTLEESDLGAFQAYRNDPEVGQFQGWEPMSDERAQEFIAAMEAVRGPVAGEWIQLGVVERKSGELIGDAGIHLSPDARVAEIGLSLSRAHQGRGLATESFSLLIDHVFRYSGCESIRGVIDANNTSSIRLAERHGFIKVDEVETIFRGSPCTEVTYLLRNPCS